MTKKILLLMLGFMMVLQPKSKADEGMWLPFLIDKLLYEKMEEMGLKLSPEQIFSLNEPGLKDAIVSFGGFCTGEIISERGLVLTNHHCGYRQIQSHSSVENDILHEGFWAQSLEEELHNPGLFVSFLVSVQDVTEKVEAELLPEMSFDERESAIRTVSARLAEEATADTHYTANVRPMFAGNEFFLFVYERFTDIRLVGTPPNSIGKYGGDTDNWMWPRHTGDFALFRVYTAPDGSPADYSPDNVPLVPKHHLPISIKGVQEGDFAMVLGYSGRTERYLTSHGIEYKLEYEYPIRIDIRRAKLDVLDEAMAASHEVRIKYASKHAGIANYWKNFIGMSGSLERLGVAAEKKDLENRFEEWLAEDSERIETFGKVMNMYEEAYAGLAKAQSHNFYFLESIWTGPEIIRLAHGYNNLLRMIKAKESKEDIEGEADRLRANLDRFFNDFDRNVDQTLWATLIPIYFDGVLEQHRPDVYAEIMKKYKNDYEKFAKEVYASTLFADRARLEAFLDKPRAKELEKDWAFKMAHSVMDAFRSVQAEQEEYDRMLNTAQRLFIKGLRQMDPEMLFYPDANSTMRFTYGSVQGYSPADAVWYNYETTITGVMEKKNQDDPEFEVPQRLIELYRDRNYGVYGSDDTLVVNFISNNDITGGNSGSPVIDGEGNLIGLAFDGNWEAMSGDILFDNDTQRCINVDARYILFIIDKYAGASHLLEEMTIIAE